MFKKSKFIKSVLDFLIKNTKHDRQYKDHILDLLLDTKEKTVLDLVNEGYLVDIGWFNAFEKKEPVGINNEPIPWITYPAIEFLSARLCSQMDIFEFGAGHSTLYYSTRVASVTSVEHDASWYEKIKSTMPGNVNLLFKELKYDGEYCRTALVDDRKYDIIIVDGRDRVNCMKYSLPALKNNGVMILDDSQRNEYLEGKEYLSNAGFKYIEFKGISPGYFSSSNTTIYYKDSNCVGL
jgi:hypothetical protein